MIGESRITRGLRVLHSNGLRTFSKTVTRHLLHRYVAPRVRDRIDRRLLTQADLARICEREGSTCRKYDDPITCRFNPPKTPVKLSVSNRRQWHRTFGEEIHIDRPFAALIPDVSLLPPDTIPVRDGMFLPIGMSSRQVATGYLMSLLRGHYPPAVISSGNTEYVDTAICLTGPLARNYYHWFNNYLVRLRGYEWFTEHTDTEPSVIIPSDPSRWMEDSLRAVGIPDDAWIQWPDQRTHVDNYLVSIPGLSPSDDTTGRTQLTSPETYRWLGSRTRKGILGANTTSRDRRIYVSRENASTRAVINEDAVMDVLGEWRFEKFQTEELSFAEQVTLFAEADAIAGAHGAGLMNLLFAGDATVVEFLGPKTTYGNPGIFYAIAGSLGYEYGCLEATVTDRDLWVDPEQCRVLLEALDL